MHDATVRTTQPQYIFYNIACIITILTIVIHAQRSIILYDIIILCLIAPATLNLHPIRIGLIVHYHCSWLYVVRSRDVGVGTTVVVVTYRSRCYYLQPAGCSTRPRTISRSVIIYRTPDIFLILIFQLYVCANVQ